MEYSPGPRDCEIIGESPALKKVLDKARRIAPSDATVLILGEPGTGKDLMAREIHRLSRRRQSNFTRFDCSAIPPRLLNIKLFGHEKGRLAGPPQRNVAGLELADRGTLFLDGVSNLSPELQKKLLKVLQSGVFEKAGSHGSMRTDIRLLAATSDDLAHCVRKGSFRADLYYRLSVFPIVMPALRQRIEDIPLLVAYFAQKFARRMNKKIETISAEGIRALASSEWPGNVRELESVIEREVSLSEGSVLQIPEAHLPGSGAHRPTLGI